MYVKTHIGRLLLVFLTVWLFGAFSENAYSQPGTPSVVTKFISKQASDEEATEYPGARKIVHGDVNRDGKPDLVVLYTLEGFNGGNNYSQYLAVFVSSGRTFRYVAHDGVGGKLVRGVTLRSVSAGRIHLDTKEYRDSDGACCPSRKAKATYILQGRKLKELP